MGSEKAIKYGKEHRKEYRNWRAVDSWCRCHGGCPWCTGNRIHKFNKQKERARWEIKTYWKSPSDFGNEA